jgi:hypothetical protein
MYRDVLVNLRAPGLDLVCEVQITLTGIAILKKSEQKIYSIMRMSSGQELLETSVFSRSAVPKASESPEGGVARMQASSVPLSSNGTQPAVEPLSPLSPGLRRRAPNPWDEKGTAWAGIMPSPEGAWAKLPLSPSTQRYATEQGTDEELEPLSAK